MTVEDPHPSRTHVFTLYVISGTDADQLADIVNQALHRSFADENYKLLREEVVATDAGNGHVTSSTKAWVEVPKHPERWDPGL